MRAALVLAHRYVGLLLAGFLLLAGVTGSVLAWYEELDAAVNPHLFHVAPPGDGAVPPDPLRLRELVAEALPGARVDFVPLLRRPGEAVFFLVAPKPGAALANDQVFANPHSGELLGGRRWGDIGQGSTNLLPFIYRLHYSLALDTAGTTLLGIVALLWAIDCWVGAALTFPARRHRSGRPWLARWWPAWQVRRGTSAYKLQVDLHRAGGLWPWAMLFIVAWSSVGFNLQVVYDPVMRAAFAHQPAEEMLPHRASPQAQPGMSWEAALANGRRLMRDAAAVRGATVLEETLLRYDPGTATFRYVVKSSADIRDRYGSTAVVFDANTGEPRFHWWPTGAAAGDTIRTWITSLHLAALWGMPFKAFMCVLGLAVAVLSVTGVVIWQRKRQGRRATRAGPSPAAGIGNAH